MSRRREHPRARIYHQDLVAAYDGLRWSSPAEWLTASIRILWAMTRDPGMEYDPDGPFAGRVRRTARKLGAACCVVERGGRDGYDPPDVIY